ncbi:MAG TPA: hypothetical protein VKG25_12420 [Bryobacteraceae bacterium]|nr:hypothetical protein [Bryobacteraceae bacterium]
MCLLAAGAGIGRAASIPGSDVQQLVQRSTAEIASDWNQAPNYSYVDREVESQHGEHPTAKTYEVIMLDGSPYKRLIGAGDEPLSLAEQANEEHKFRAEIRKRQRESAEARARRISKYAQDRHRDSALIKAMVDAFAFSLIASETVDHHDCWVLDATPKPGYQPSSRETKVLAGMRGRMWIDKASGQWVRVQAEVFEAVSFYGFFAKVRPGTKFLLEQQPISGNLWLPKHFRMQVSASVLGFFNEDSTDDETYSNYRPMAQALAPLGTH